ncbi:MAG: T9SS C-terminal target domain-containing protein, partial [Flavobacteriaceae bacterium]|nr:T9SS C-terminal target domain-containing protein [Flavobacteriaceae bacterium]
MKEKIVLICLFLICSSIEAQIENINSKYDLPNTVSETSGLLFYNGKLITHNDSGDNANLYELDTISGNITRTIHITNATNVDWEDITQDETYIYIGDFGNNNGNRQDLKIYRILKSDFNNGTSITSEVISFSYEDQVNFTTN